MVYVHQHPVLFSVQVAANVGYGLRARGVAQPQLQARVHEALQWAGIGHLPGAAVRNLSVLAGGDGAHALRFARLTPGATQWSATQTVVERNDLFVNWADFPSVLPTSGGRLVAHWLQKSGADTYAYDVRVAQSLDGGNTWSEPRVLHDDGVAAEHGFVSLWETKQGEVQAVWLDGREASEASPHPQTQLGFTTLSSEGVPGPTELIDTRTCDCCQTDAALAAQGPVVAYRDRSDSEVRDIQVLRRVDGAWSAAVRGHAGPYTPLTLPTKREV